VPLKYEVVHVVHIQNHASYVAYMRGKQMVRDRAKQSPFKVYDGGDGRTIYEVS